jgi:hypothetical protein
MRDEEKKEGKKGNPNYLPARVVPASWRRQKKEDVEVGLLDVFILGTSGMRAKQYVLTL